MATGSATDRSVGLGIVFSIVAVLAALATAAFGYQSALTHGVGNAQVLSGIAFGLAILVGTIGIVAIHVFAE